MLSENLVFAKDKMLTKSYLVVFAYLDYRNMCNNNRTTSQQKSGR